MKNAIKGALLSGLVFPGLGQVMLKRPGRGAVIIVAMVVIVAEIAIKAWQQALAILETLDLSGGVIDLTAITDATSRALAGPGDHHFDILSLLMLACWLIGVVDGYLIGRKMDLDQRSSGQIEPIKSGK
jgi:TM2 domain-containing membrane protein YozV